MKINSKSISLDRAGNLLDGPPADDAITIEVAQFDHFSISRKQRRHEQSVAAREVLESMLLRLYRRYRIESWPLVKSPSGKPYLLGNDLPSISIAHSGDWVACAIAASATVGVDIEVIKSRNWDAYCRDVFYPAEALWVSGASGDEQNIRGLTCWCRKEAIVKALGKGMVTPPSGIGFSPEGTLIALPKELGPSSDWVSYSTVVYDKAVVSVTWKCESK